MYRGEVWLVNLDPTVGTEISKKRPCIIVNDDAIGILPLKVIVPLTDWKIILTSIRSRFLLHWIPCKRQDFIRKLK
jgi:mRNA-degrading endonuclease toxin of MazEF toxin-antitoxin module